MKMKTSLFSGATKQRALCILAALTGLLIQGCATPTFLPHRIQEARHGVLLNLKQTQRAHLTTEEFSQLKPLLDDRIFTSTRPAPNAELYLKIHVITVVFASPRTETQFHVFADGTVGYLRTLKEYYIIPMPEFSEAAHKLASQYNMTTPEIDEAFANKKMRDIWNQ